MHSSLKYAEIYRWQCTAGNIVFGHWFGNSRRSSSGRRQSLGGTRAFSIHNEQRATITVSITAASSSSSPSECSSLAGHPQWYTDFAHVLFIRLFFFFFSYFDGCLCVFSVLSIHLPPSKCRLTANYIFLSYIDFFTDYRLGGVRESIWQPSEGKAQLLRNDDDFRFVSDNLFSDQLQGMTTLENCDGFMPIRNGEYVASSMGVLMLPNSQIIYIYIV